MDTYHDRASFLAPFLFCLDSMYISVVSIVPFMIQGGGAALHYNTKSLMGFSDISDNTV
jgi:hypothetical protein